MGTTNKKGAAARRPPTAAEVAPPAEIAGEVAAAVAAFEGFLADRDPAAPLTLLCHSDADGLASGAVLQRGLERRGHTRVTTLVTGRGENAWDPRVRERLAATAPQR